MRRFAVLFLAIAFLANTITVAAWAKPCMTSGDVSMTTTSSEMPCHEKKEQKPPNKHCEGICLCFHVSISQTPILGSDIAYIKQGRIAEKFVISNENKASLAVTPPRRPPKHTT